MKTIIAGSRSIKTYETVKSVIESAPFVSQITEVFCGMAAGADIFGFRWATERKIPVKQFRPEWDKYGKVAGIIRNCEMCAYADAIIVVWDGRSTGSAHIIKYSKGIDPKLQRHIVNVGVQEQTLEDYGREQSA